MKWIASVIKKINPVDYIKKAGAFSIGMFLGVCYGSVVSTITTYFLLKAVL